jgi:hypothetical protein
MNKLRRGCRIKNKRQYKKMCFQTNYRYLIEISCVQMKSWAGKALETVNCCAFLERKVIGAC